MSSTPPQFCYIDATGFHSSTYATINAWMTEAFQSIFGADIDLDPDSQDGAIVAIYSRAIYDNQLIAQNIYSSFSPTYAQSDALSRNVEINGIERYAATYSTAEIVIVGVQGTNILSGQIQDVLSQTWILPASVVIPSSGTITVTATAQNIGAVLADPNTITVILTPTRGWQTANNPAAATVGVSIETDAELRIRQQQSVALASLSVLDGTIGAIAAVPGVTSVRVYENDTNLTDGDGIPPHSISAVVEGGNDTAIATAIAVKKTPGTGTYGTTTVIVYDQYEIPNPINFYRPTIDTIGVQIDIHAFTGYITEYATEIANAVAAYINALGIGQDVLITKLYVPANLPGTVAGSTYDITNIEINLDGGSYAASNITVAFNELAFCDPVADITVNLV